MREIRGEIYMKLSVFKKYRTEFANPRNLAAGAIKQKDPAKTREYQLSFFGYDLLGFPLKAEIEKLELLRSFHVPTVEAKRIKKEKMREIYDYFLAKRESHDYETDGVVLKADSISEQERLGFTAHHPRYAIAYKFQGDSGVTTLRDVEWSVARTGVITPVGVVEPVELSGAMVTRVSLHNYGMMKELGLRKGSKVLMMRRGGVIPNLESVVEAGRGEPVEPPGKCPACGSRTERREDFLYCTNREGCRKAKRDELEHFIKVIECDGFGEKLIEQIYDSGFVKDASDFYQLKKENLLELERMGEVLATKLIGNLQARRELPLDLFLRSLGIRELAKHASKILMKQFRTLDRILKVSEEELSAIHSIGPVIAKEVVEGLKRKRGLIERLLRYVTLAENPPIPPLSKGGSLRGKKFLFTGSLVSMERGKAEKLVEAKGGEVASGVTQDLDYLVVGDGGVLRQVQGPGRSRGRAGSKLEKAKALQAKGGEVKIVSEGEWKRLMVSGGAKTPQTENRSRGS
ncbi:MAG: NAD-dependent DNA ligase LigA [Deltaproteobacteria bacterium]|nr:NAD-dependent DNA ligase LigA [Deltaproteobacteria bacterium]